MKIKWELKTSIFGFTASEEQVFGTCFVLSIWLFLYIELEPPPSNMMILFTGAAKSR